MAQVFSRRADRILRVALGALALLAVVAGLRLVGVIPPDAAAGTPAAPPQPRPFSHFHHVAEIGVACGYCHTGAEHGPQAGFPSVETCAGCHLSTAEPRPPLPPPLAWTRVTPVRDFIRFDHSVHVGRDIDCAVCHGRVDLMHETRYAQPQTMEFCLDCHRETARARGIDPMRLTNCNVCHY